MPLYALRSWSADVADLEGGEAVDRGNAGVRDCIRWDGEEAEQIQSDQARPGDTLVLPAAAGGCDRYGWAPRSLEPVTDRGDTPRRVRLHPAIHPELAEEIRALLADEVASADDWRALALRTGVLAGAPGRVLAQKSVASSPATSPW